MMMLDNLHTHVIVPDNKSPVEKVTSEKKSFCKTNSKKTVDRKPARPAGRNKRQPETRNYKKPGEHTTRVGNNPLPAMYLALIKIEKLTGFHPCERVYAAVS